MHTTVQIHVAMHSYSYRYYTKMALFHVCISIVCSKNTSYLCCYLPVWKVEVGVRWGREGEGRKGEGKEEGGGGREGVGGGGREGGRGREEGGRSEEGKGREREGVGGRW